MTAVDKWGNPPPETKAGRRSKYVPFLDEIKERYQGGDTNTWGVIGTFERANTATSTMGYLRKTQPEFEFRRSSQPNSSGLYELWAHWKGVELDG